MSMNMNASKTMSKNIIPVNEEIFFSDDEIIVSKTNLKGQITYVNDIFCKVAELRAKDAIGAPHNIIRHPDMPRTIFKLLWETISSKNEIFAYVKNISMTGKYYWVLAHVTPTLNSTGEITGYHSTRRNIDNRKIEFVRDLYQQIRDVEQRQTTPKKALEEGQAFLESYLLETGKTYNEFIWS